MAVRLLLHAWSVVIAALLLVAPCLSLAGRPSASIAKAFTTARPPRGAVYTRTLRLPVLGKQEMWLRIDSRDRATLRLHGPLCLDDTVRYSVQDGELVFQLGVRTRQLLHRVRRAAHLSGSASGPPMRRSGGLPELCSSKNTCFGGNCKSLQCLVPFGKQRGGQGNASPTSMRRRVTLMGLMAGL